MAVSTSAFHRLPLTEETQQKMKEVKIVVPRMELLKCIFFGKRGKVVTLCWKGDSHSYGSMPLSTFECPTLNLRIAYRGNSIYQLPNSVYVHVYKNTIACSYFKLSMALAFFSFDVGLVELPDNSAIDIMPFVFGGEDLRICACP